MRRTRIGAAGAAMVMLAGAAGAATYTWTGGAGDGLFSTPGNWDGGAAPVAATTADNLVFTTAGTATNDIANLTVGDIAVTLAAGEELTLGGGKFNGSGTFSLNGAGRLVFDATGGLDAQPIVINGGIFKVGDSLTGSAFGSASDDVPIRVNAGGTLDVNYGLSGIDYARSQVTHDKLIYIAGTGAAGYGATGAIINSASKNGGNTYTLGDIVLTADATIGGSNRVDVVTLVDDDGIEYGARATHASVTGPYVLTFADADPSRAIYKGLWKGSVNVKSITVTFGAELILGTNVTFTLTDSVLNLVDGGKICTWTQDYRFPYPVNVAGGDNRIRCGSGQGYFDGALAVPSGAGLAVSGGTVNFYGPVEISGAVTNTGAQLHFYTEVQGNTVAAAAGNTTYFHGGLYGVVTLLGKSNAAGQAVFYEDTSPFYGYFRTNGEGTIDGRTGEYVRIKNNIFAGSASNFTKIGGITVNDQDNFGTYGDTIENVVLFSNSTFNVTGAFTAGRVGPRSGGNLSVARLGGNTTVTAHSVLIGFDGDETIKDYGAIELLPGSVVNATNNVCVGYHYYLNSKGALTHSTTIPKGTVNEWITVDGGTLNAADCGIGVGGWGPQSRFYLKSGTVNAKGLVFQATRPKGATAAATGGLCKGGTNTFRFVMSGGTLNLGAWGMESLGREDNSEANVILAGGTLNATDDFSILYYNPTLFGNGNWRGGAAGGFTLNTAGHTATLTTALNGAGDVRLTGNGTVAGTNAIQGVLGGTWTVDGGMAADLRGASSLLGGLSVGANAAVTLDVGAERSAAFFTRDGSWPLTDTDGKTILDRFNESDGGTVSTLISHDMGLLNVSTGTKPNYMGGTREAYVSKGEFYVAPEEAGTWTFSAIYTARIYIQVDDESATSTGAKIYARLQPNLSPGWHRFVIIGETSGASFGPANRKGMAVGFAKTAVSGDAAADYTLFSPKNLKMRPSAPCGGEASVRWSTVKGTKWAETTWATPSASNYTNNWDWDTVCLTNSLRLLDLHGKGYDRLNTNVVNRWDGWFHVPSAKAGTWRFRLLYDDRVTLFLDGARVAATAAYNAAVEEDVPVTPGWHRYEICTFDGSGSFGPGEGSAVSYAVKTAADADFGAFVPFDEDSLTLSLAPDGYLQGEIALASGAAVTNVSETAAVVWGDVRVADGAAGAVMSGKFACVSNTVDFGTVAANTSDLSAVLRFDDAATNLFADVGRIAVDFASRPTFGRALVGPAGGLDALSDAELARRFEVTVDGVPAAEAKCTVLPLVEDGKLYLRNLSGTTMIIR